MNVVRINPTAWTTNTPRKFNTVSSATPGYGKLELEMVP
jgi:hypothetical protein